MKRGGGDPIGVGALISGRGGDASVSGPRSNDQQRGSRSGGGSSTFNVYSHLGQGDVDNPYEQHNLAVVAPRDFHGTTDPINHRSSTHR
ncbi:unnamed protein product [Ectocarpus sp. 13 AM-2016]